MDPRVKKLAEVLVHYSLEIRAGQQVAISSSPPGEELALAAYGEALRTGAHVTLWYEAPEEQEMLFKLATDAQLDYISPVQRLVFETFDASLHIGAERNTRALSHTDPARQARFVQSHQPLFEIVMQRSARQELRWCYTAFPTQAAAQEAEMSLTEYQDFVYTAGKLNEPDPIAAWQAEGQRQRELQAWLQGKDQVVLKGPDVELRFSIAGRTLAVADGKENFPDGEIYTSPVEDSANGWIRFRYPALFNGREVADVELWFEQGKVVREKASKGGDLLASLLDSDAGARYLGEWGTGTNYDIPCFTRDMLFDEKLGGTIHLALGAGFPETGGRNKSGLHWDLLCDMKEGEIVVDGEVFYRQGKPVLWS